MGLRTTPVIQLLCLVLAWVSSISVRAEKPSAAISFAEIGAKATADYQGDALGITATAEGARLRCAFQRLNGDATPEGLWLTSTADNSHGERFRVMAVAVGREGDSSYQNDFYLSLLNLSAADVWPLQSPTRETRADSRWLPESDWTLDRSGKVAVTENLVRFIRPGLTEEYSVSVDGVRQDFVIESPPLVTPPGELRVELALSGARAEATAYGAKLTLEGSSRTLAYSRLRATDATGKELKARMEVVAATRQSAAVLDEEDSGSLPTRRYARLAVVVDDADAVYPVRIDPTFSDEDWISMSDLLGANGYVGATAVDGSGNLYIGGKFTMVGNVFATNVAKWNGSAWSSLGAGVQGYCVYALVVSGNDLYVGGEITTAGGSAAANAAKWDGNGWAALGSGLGGSVIALAVSGTNLYVGGAFTTAGGSAASGIAKWNGSSWSPLGSGVAGTYPYVRALAVLGSDLYVGGGFKWAGSVEVNGIAKWNGSSWSALGSGVNNYVAALAVSGNNLYVGGEFKKAGGLAATNVAKWNGSSWSALGAGIWGVDYHHVTALAVSGSDLYVGGSFETAGGSAANCVAKWNGSSWSALGSGLDGGVNALAVSGTNLYVGGYFATAGGGTANYVARWKGSSWSALGSGLDGLVNALAVSGGDLYVGGDFATACGSPASRVAKWDGSRWSALGSGISGPSGYPYYGGSVSVLAVSGSDLYVGGFFTTAGGSPANRVARWDGNSWWALGSGLNSNVNALAVSGSDLYVGGAFTRAGGSAATNVAKWDGSSWSALGSGVGGSVNALVMSGSDLYVGGDFYRAGGRTAYYVAKWNGTSWSALGSGLNRLNGTAYALAVSGSDLYVGGSFGTAGGSAAHCVAKWDGSSWSGLGSGVGETTADCVYALVVSGSDLYAAGAFTAAGGSAAKYVAKWDGSSWSALGSGISGPSGYPYYGGSVFALAVSGSDLYVGGWFTTAGGKVSAYLARANLIPQRGVIQNLGLNGGTVALDCLGLPGTAFTVQRATDVQFTADLTTLLTTNAPAPNGQFRCTDSNPPSATAFYRLLRQ